MKLIAVADVVTVDRHRIVRSCRYSGGRFTRSCSSSTLFGAAISSLGRYHINVFWSDEADYYYVEDVPDSIRARPSALPQRRPRRGVQMAKRAWLDSAQERGNPIPEPSCDRQALHEVLASEAR